MMNRKSGYSVFLFSGRKTHRSIARILFTLIENKQWRTINKSMTSIYLICFKRGRWFIAQQWLLANKQFQDFTYSSRMSCIIAFHIRWPHPPSLSSNSFSLATNGPILTVLFSPAALSAAIVSSAGTIPSLQSEKSWEKRKRYGLCETAQYYHDKHYDLHGIAYKIV